MNAIIIKRDTITPELQRLFATTKNPRAIMEAGAKTVQVEISRHLRQLQARGNKKGWPPQRFFAGRSTSVEKNVGISSLTDRSATITIADPRFVHRIQGGQVTAKRRKFLAIPLTAEAYAAQGKGSIKESMPGLFVVKFKRGLYLVRETGEKTRNGATGKRKFGLIQRLRIFPLFKLVRSVTQKPHPEELPDPNQLSQAAAAAMLAAGKLLFKAK